MKLEAALDLRGACFAAGLAFLMSVANADQYETSLVVDLGDGQAAVIANDVPMREVLEELALQSGIIVYSRAALNMRVTYSVREASIPDLIRRILRNHNFTLHYVSDAATALPEFGSRLWILADNATSTTVWSVGEPAREWTLRYSAGDPEKSRLRAISNIATWENASQIDPDVLVAMNDPAVAVRAEAIHVLGELNVPESLGHLKNALYDPERGVRVVAIDALADSGLDDAVPLLADLLNDPDQAIRAEVIHAMADIGGEIAHHYMQQALSDANEINRETAAAYLSEIATAHLPR
jgi:HEAT repeat protein